MGKNQVGEPGVEQVSIWGLHQFLGIFWGGGWLGVVVVA